MVTPRFSRVGALRALSVPLSPRWSGDRARRSTRGGFGLRQRVLLDEEPEVVGTARCRQRLPEIDRAPLVERQQALIERLHPVVLAVGDDLVDLVRLFR